MVSRPSCCGTDRCCGTRGSSVSPSRSPGSCSPRTSSKPSAARDCRSASSRVPVSRSTRPSRSRPALATSDGCRHSSRIGSASSSCSRESSTRRSSRWTPIRRRELGPVARRYLWLFVPAGVTTVGLILPIAPGAAVRPVPCPARNHRWWRGHLRRGCLAPGPSGPRRPATRTLYGANVGQNARHSRSSRDRSGRAALSCSNVKATNHDGSPPSDGPSMRTRTARASWVPGCRRSSSGTRDARPSPFTTRGAEVLGASGSIEPTYIVFSNIDQRRASPKTIERYRELVVPRGRPPWTARPPRSRSTASRRKRNFVLDSGDYSERVPALFGTLQPQGEIHASLARSPALVRAPCSSVRWPSPARPAAADIGPTTTCTNGVPDTRRPRGDLRSHDRQHDHADWRIRGGHRP